MSYDPADDAEDYRRESLDRDDNETCVECGLRLDGWINGVDETVRDAHGQGFCDSFCKTLFHSDDTEHAE